MVRIEYAAISGVAAAFMLLSGTASAQSAKPASFAMCGACHSVKAGENRVGPTLFGVVGRKVGGLPTAKYSPAMKAKGGTWTKAALDAYLANPRGTVPGTTMSFAGQKDAAKRAEIIAYLESLK